MQLQLQAGLHLQTLLIGLAGVLLLMTIPNDARAQFSDDVKEAAMRDFHGDDMTGKDGPLAKAELDLLMLYHAYTSEKSTTGVAAAEGDTSYGEMNLRDGRVTVDAVANGDVAALKSDLEALGMTRAATAAPMVSGRFPIENVPELARLETLRSVQVARPATQSASGGRTPTLRDTNAVPPEALARGERGNEAAETPRSEEANANVSPEETTSSETAASETPPDDGLADERAEGPAEADAATPRSDGDVSSTPSPSTTKDSESKGGPAGLLLLVLAASLILFLDV